MGNALRLTVAEYDQMVERGAFDTLNRRIELLHGEIQTMNPAGPQHDDIIEFLNHWSTRSTSPERIRVRVQSGLSIAELDSRPEPDVTWVRKANYRHHHPRAEDVLLLIEVADSSLDTDRQIKAELYAKAGVVEYWVVNVPGSVVHVFREPSPSSYNLMRTYSTGESLAPQAAPSASLDVGELFAES